LALHPENEVLSLHEFEQISDLAYRTCGISLDGGKQQLVQARLGKKIREGKFGSFREYYHHVLADSSGGELAAMLDALTTNFTSFLREPAHFEFLRSTILPGFEDPIRIWCAAASTGEEPYTIAFSLLDGRGMKAGGRARILATDISNRALASAHRAAYPAERFAACPPDWLAKYLLRGAGRWEGWYRVKPAVRNMIEFRRLNLMEPFQHPRPFQVIFCRNVMIYFDKATRQDLVCRMAACLEPGGYLLIGHAESLAGMRHPYLYIQPAVYRKPL
jgi:chemotaxis protein methyltransferase CheR